MSSSHQPRGCRIGPARDISTAIVPRGVCSMIKRLALTFAACLCLLAQTERGNITGVVTDSTGAAVPGAAVTITHRATNTTVRLSTTNAGEYNAAALNPGDYSIEVVAQG